MALHENPGADGSCLAAAKGNPLTIRTYDIGADKLVDSVGIKPSPNPALGLRGLRLCLEHPELLRTQLQALLRAGARGDLRVILPMVGGEAEWDAAMAILEEAKENLRCRKMAFNEDLPVGAMIEIPSAALSARGLAARGCRSFCIGTNDLAQYKNDLVFVGGIDAQTFFVNATPQQITDEVKRVREILGPNYIVSPSHEEILPNVPAANVLAMAKAAKENL